ncbi:flagellar export chaperone FliS [Fervidibacillus halotolerans]|uniref:Flagellar secretion chaperone FliS n=1 Tax=Fervidibacillus halotolerans TaxID=2980027 RepID=A0A9E8RXQ0_9BACI|nr:flagellar export chaperone FliS [Fervidibacillus halotolerans]WAA12016.1 flagellar export chaperone FliS [Fervidibacillus halotolerans]
MAIQNPYQAYQTNSVNTATPGELTLMLYNGCLKFIQLAKKALDDNNIEEKNKNIQKAQDIISELMSTLNMDIEISHQMLPLYDFVRSKLIEANVKNSVQSLEEAESIITEFRDTWKQVIQINRKQMHDKGGQA